MLLSQLFHRTENGLPRCFWITRRRTVVNNTFDIHEFLSNLRKKNELDTDFKPIDERLEYISTVTH